MLLPGFARAALMDLQKRTSLAYAPIQPADFRLVLREGVNKTSRSTCSEAKMEARHQENTSFGKQGRRGPRSLFKVRNSESNLQVGHVFLLRGLPNAHKRDQSIRGNIMANHCFLQINMKLFEPFMLLNAILRHPNFIYFVQFSRFKT